MQATWCRYAYAVEQDDMIEHNNLEQLEWAAFYHFIDKRQEDDQQDEE